MEHRVLAGIVTFNPELERLRQNVDSVIGQVESVLIVDNSSENIAEILEVFRFTEGITVIRNSKNAGIAKALNQIGQYAKDNGYSLFLTLDQDSISDTNLVNTLKAEMVPDHVAMVCPFICLDNNFCPKNNANEVKTAITSGSLVLTEAWDRVNGFWEYLFIDEVDHEFCYVLRKHGYTILQVQSVAIEHIIGKPMVKKILGHVFHPTNHSAFRKYYIVRNSIIMKHLYPDERKPFAHRYFSIFKMTVSMLLCEEHKTAKFKAIIRGAMDAFKWIHNVGEIKSRRE